MKFIPWIRPTTGVLPGKFVSASSVSDQFVSLACGATGGAFAAFYRLHRCGRLVGCRRRGCRDCRRIAGRTLPGGLLLARMKDLVSKHKKPPHPPPAPTPPERPPSPANRAAFLHGHTGSAPASANRESFFSRVFRALVRMNFGSMVSGSLWRRDDFLEARRTDSITVPATAWSRTSCAGRRRGRRI